MRRENQTSKKQAVRRTKANRCSKVNLAFLAWYCDRGVVKTDVICKILAFTSTALASTLSKAKQT